MTSCIIDNIAELINEADTNIESIKSKNERKSGTIVMFDLVGSTSLKIKKGHDEAVKQMIQHNQVCRKFVKNFKGTTIKEIGDSVLAHFDDTETACLCAINFIEAVIKLEIQTKISISSGKIEFLTIEDNPDAVGAVVDLCSRIEKFVFPNQIIIDVTTHDSVQSFLKNYDDMEISKPMKAVIKGHDDKKELFEIANKTQGLKNLLNISLQVTEEGRLSIDDKVSFILNAKNEVIEIGNRLREFTSYFYSRNPVEFKNHVLALLKNGVKLKCYALDSRWALDNLPINSKEEKKYFEEIPETLNKLLEFKKEVSDKNLSGSVEIFIYQHVPLFHVQCTDGDSAEGRMTVSNYLFGIKRSQCPVIQFSKQSNPTMFSTYWESIQNIVKTSKPWSG